MTFKRPLSVSPIRVGQTKNLSSKFHICQVCGDQAHINNYGALSCSSCKTFFRRNGFNIKDVPKCLHEGQCSITISTRKLCTACRFTKCISVGMCSELIRKEDLHEKYRSRQKVLLKQQIIPLRQPQLYTLNLLSRDSSSLTSDDWRLFSNVVHAFDTYNSVPNTQKIVDSISRPDGNIKAGLETSLDMIASIYTALQSFINSTADFRIMTTDEQCSLLQRNMYSLLALYSIFVFRTAGVFDNNRTENAVLPLYSYQHVQSTKSICKQLEDDTTLVKLMLIVLLFSSNIFIVDDENDGSKDVLLYGTYRLYGSQNVYVELLWKYMTYRYGFSEAVRRFNNLIKITLNALQLGANVYTSNKVHQDFIDDLADQCENVLKINGSEQTPLWGKD